jgi:hypothetical protein
VPECVRLWQELSGVKVGGFLPFRDGWLVNEKYYIFQEGGDIHEWKWEGRQAETGRQGPV